MSGKGKALIDVKHLIYLRYSSLTYVLHRVSIIFVLGIQRQIFEYLMFYKQFLFRLNFQLLLRKKKKKITLSTEISDSMICFIEGLQGY